MVEPTLTISSCYSKATVNGNDNVGGLIGYGTLFVIVLDCYAKGSVTGNDKIGGLIGNLTTGDVTQCYATGLVTGVTNAGGLLGYTGLTFYDSYWDVTTTSQATSAGYSSGYGLLTASMVYPYEYDGTYYSWDNIPHIWQDDTALANGGYPTHGTGIFTPKSSPS
jgi:hypothetical protein